MSILTKLTSRYVVVAQFDGQVKQHYARDWDDALDWAACYAANDTCAIYQSFLGLISISPVAVRFA